MSVFEKKKKNYALQLIIENLLIFNYKALVNIEKKVKV